MSKRILIIDPDPTFRRLLALYLGKFFEVAEAEEGQDGLQQFNTQSFDLVISEIHLPGLSGISVLGKIFDLNPHTGLILMSMYPTPITPPANLANIPILIKPFSLEKTMELIHKLTTRP